MQQYSTRLWVPLENDCNVFGIRDLELRSARQTGGGGYPYVADGAKLSPFRGC